MRKSNVHGELRIVGGVGGLEGLGSRTRFRGFRYVEIALMARLRIVSHLPIYTCYPSCKTAKNLQKDPTHEAHLRPSKQNVISFIPQERTHQLNYLAPGFETSELSAVQAASEACPPWLLHELFQWVGRLRPPLRQKVGHKVLVRFLQLYCISFQRAWFESPTFPQGSLS